MEIGKNIDAKILGSQPIQFRSSGVRPADDGGRLRVEGALLMAGSTEPLTVNLSVKDGGAISGTIPLRQSDWGIKPYRGLMGALKVRDEIEVVIEANLASIEADLKIAPAIFIPQGRPPPSGTFVRIDAVVVRACHFHEKLGPRLDASSFRRRWPSVSSQCDRPRRRKGQKHSDHAPLSA